MPGVVVHEWIAQSGGSENVAQAFADLYPGADVFCLWNDSRGRFDPDRLHESWLARTPLRRSKALALPFMPATWRTLGDHGYDWALISSHLFAHQARFTRAGHDIPRFVYVHSPARYLWNPELDTRGANPAVRAVGSLFKGVDRRRARGTREFAANSEFVRERMRVAWGVDARVIVPPVEVTAIQAVEEWAEQVEQEEADALAALPDTFLLGASRFIPYKRLDLVIAAAESVGLPLVLAGNGPELPRLQAIAAAASVPVQFVLSPSNALLRALYQRAAVFVFPAIEDFGIMPVEAMAAGAPVVAGAVGGTAETVVPARTGAIADFDSPDSVRHAIDEALRIDRVALRESAREFSVERFGERIRDWVGDRD